MKAASQRELVVNYLINFGPGEDKCDFSQNPNASDGSATEPLSTRLFKARLQVIAELDDKPQVTKA